MKLTQEEYKKLKDDELISINIWLLKEYPSDLSPIDRCSLKYDRDRVYEFDNLLTESECNQITFPVGERLSKTNTFLRSEIAV